MSTSFNAYVSHMFIPILLVVLGSVIIILAVAVSRRCRLIKDRDRNKDIPPPVIDEEGEDWKKRLVDAVDQQQSNSTELQELLRLWLDDVARTKRENARNSHVTKGL